MQFVCVTWLGYFPKARPHFEDMQNFIEERNPINLSGKCSKPYELSPLFVLQARRMSLKARCDWLHRTELKNREQKPSTSQLALKVRTSLSFCFSFQCSSFQTLRRIMMITTIFKLYFLVPLMSGASINPIAPMI